MDMELSTLVKILTTAPPSHRYIAIDAGQSMNSYARKFGEPVPDWVKSEAKGHIAVLCKMAIQANEQLPSCKPDRQSIQAFLDEQKNAAAQSALERWGATPAEFHNKLERLFDGPYDQLLEAVLFLRERIVEYRNAGDAEGSAPWEQVEIDVFGDAERLFEVSENGWCEFTASRMDGPSIDVFEVSGLPWKDDISDGVWGNTNWEALFQCCPEVDFQEQETIDEMPGQSDTYFTVSIHDPRNFARELRIAMLSFTVFSDDRATS
jgi:hypothetical protein